MFLWLTTLFWLHMRLGKLENTRGEKRKGRKIMSEHVPGVDMVAQAEVVELKGKVRDYEKEIKEYEKKDEKQQEEIKRLRGIAGKSYGVGTMWFAAIPFLLGVGVTVAFFLLT